MRVGLRAVVPVVALAVVHLLVTLGLGLLAFITQGPLDGPMPVPAVHRAVSAAVDVLEFPLVWTVRRLDRERLRGFEAAAVGNSLLWGAVLALALQLLRPHSRPAG
jgi:hypothetical protein